MLLISRSYCPLLDFDKRGHNFPIQQIFIVFISVLEAPIKMNIFLLFVCYANVYGFSIIMQIMTKLPFKGK